MEVSNITKRLLICLAIVVAMAMAGCASSQTALQTESANPTPASIPEQTLPVTETTPNTSSSPGPAAATCTKLNLNTLTEDQLMSTIPNFSARMVREFFEYRPYISIQQFRREIGKYVDANQVADYEQYVFVPVDPNQADAATLMQIPGVDSTIADTLISGRPYASTQVFLDALAGSISAEQAAASSCFLIS